MSALVVAGFAIAIGLPLLVIAAAIWWPRRSAYRTDTARSDRMRAQARLTPQPTIEPDNRWKTNQRGAAHLEVSHLGSIFIPIFPFRSHLSAMCLWPSTGLR